MKNLGNGHKDSHWTVEKNEWAQWGLQQRDGSIPNRNHKLNDTVTELKNTLEKFQQQTRWSRRKDLLSLEDKAVKLTQSKQHKEIKMKASEDSLRDLCVCVCVLVA